MNGIQAPTALYDDKSFYAESPLFYLSPGYVGVFKAFGFQPGLVLVDPAKPKTTQRACLKQVYWQLAKHEFDRPCGVFPTGPEVSQVGGAYLEETVMTDGCPWEISACDNHRALDSPGLYRFVLNDPAAVGNVFVLFYAYPAARPIAASAPTFGA
jgi:hypothetical protein